MMGWTPSDHVRGGARQSLRSAYLGSAIYLARTMLGTFKMSPPVILMYHSVDDRRGRSDLWGLSVSPQNFASQIEALTSERTVVPLEELARSVRAGRLPRGVAAITFDDGYANNATYAKP